MADVKQTKPTLRGRFRHWLTTALPANWIGDQTGLWINAPAPKLTRVNVHFISDYGAVKPHFSRGDVTFLEENISRTYVE
jgi:hypothetical protein